MGSFKIKNIPKNLLNLALHCTALCVLVLLIPKAASAATITVNGTTDTAANDGVCNLREAITAANSDTASGAAGGECAAGSGTDTINFSISGATPHTFTPGSELPSISTSMTINGCSEPDATANTAVAPNPFNGTLVVELNGTGAGAGSDGLQITGGTTTIRCLVINRFTDHGINITGGSNHVIAGNYIGTSTSGATDLGNSDHGLNIQGVSGVTVGGTAAEDRNIISGNNDEGIFITDDAADSNTILGNYIGLNAAGTGDLGNSDNGIQVTTSADSNTIGGTASGSTNVISGNNLGVLINTSGTTGNTILGNYIGLNAVGTAAVANDLQGVNIADSSASTTVGGTTSAARNVISGNTGSAVNIDSSSNNTVLGNYLGLTVNGTSAIGNGGPSASIVGINGNGNLIGGTDSGARNYIAGATGGVGIALLVGQNNTIQGNYIGTNTSGQVQSGFGLSSGGIAMVGASTISNNLIGGTASGAGNIIAGNQAGILAFAIQANIFANNSFLGNSIHSNNGHPLTSLGIDLAHDSDGNFSPDQEVGVNTNDAGDTDGTGTRANNYLNYPVISSVSSSNGTATITYSLDINGAEPGATGYRVEFFANDSADPSGFGEGQTYLGSDTVAGDVTNRQVTLTLPAGVSGVKAITSTTTMTDSSTDGFGHTSEFSAATTATLVAATSGQSLAETGDEASWIYAFSLAALTSGYFALRKVYTNS